MKVFHHIHKHIHQHHKKYLIGTAIGSIGFFAIKTIIFVVGLIGIILQTGTYATGGSDCGGWDNSQFITGSFRESNPSNAKIICALYGDGNGNTNRTAYTQNRNTVGCATGSMVVTGVTPGTDKLPTTLAANTIYVLESGSYITSATRSMNTCSAIVGKGEVEIKANYVTNTRLINSISKNNYILDNLKLNRNRGTATTTSMEVVYPVTSHSLTFNAIQAYSGYAGIYINQSNYVSINNSQLYTNLVEGITFYTSLYGVVYNSQSYNNGRYGIYYTTTSHYGTITNSQSYNNTNIGIYINTSNYATINNSQIYNNGSHGIYFLGSNYSAINNTQSYNNGGNGIQVTTASNSGVINNLQIYNNAGYGISYTSGANHDLHDTQIYNNNNIGIYMAAPSTNILYYGDNKIFANSGGAIGGTIANLSTGSDGLLGRSNGLIDTTPTMSWDYITNPKNIYGTDLLSRTSTMEALRGKSSVVNTFMQYSYGSGIVLQNQPVIYDPATNNLVISGAYSPNMYIGGSTSQLFGDILGNWDIHFSPTMNVTPTTQGAASKYNIFGDITQNIYAGDSNTSTGILLSGTLLNRKIITQFYVPSSMDMMHFQKISPALSQVQIVYTYPTATTTMVTLSGYTGVSILNNGGLATYSITGTTTLGTNLRFTFIVQDVYGNTGSIPVWMWNNDNFLTQNFWENTPSDAEIIQATYGDGSPKNDQTAYTQNRNVVGCTTGSMIVTGVAPGTDTLPVTLNANTIYVLASGSYSTTEMRNIATCSAIIGKGEVEIKANFLTDTRLILNQKNYTILDALKLNRNRGTTTGTNMDVLVVNAGKYSTVNKIEAYGGNNGIYYYSAANSGTINNSQAYDNYGYGIHIYNSSNDVTISNSIAHDNGINGMFFRTSSKNGKIINSQSYNNGSAGMAFQSTTNGMIDTCQNYNNAGPGVHLYNLVGQKINNSQMYNNTTYGIYIAISNTTTISTSQIYGNKSLGIYVQSASPYTAINNSQIYNNGSHGIYFIGSNYSSINNSQIYNNAGTAGVGITNGSYSGVINNSQIYNNAGYGIYYISGTNHEIHDTQIYNNKNVGIYMEAPATNILYYGDNKIFANSGGSLGGTIANLSTGSDGLLGRSNGLIDTTPTMSWDYITNPRNIYGTDLLSRTSTMEALRGKSSVASTSMQYSYGSGIVLQQPPAIYDPATYNLVVSGIYLPNAFIGENLQKISGDLLGISANSAQSILVTGIASFGVTTYNIYGDISQNVLGVPINTSTTIQLTTGNTTNTIIAQFYDPIAYFAMHFQKTTTIDTTPPSVPVAISPTNESILIVPATSFLRSVSVDTGVGISGYQYQISTDPTYTTNVFSGFTTSTGVSMSELENATYYRRIAAYDTASNISNRSDTWVFTRNGDVVVPFVGTGYIFSGITGNIASNLYYKGTITIRAELSGTHISSCEYTTGQSRESASVYSGYCERSGLSFANDITIKFRASNTLGMSTGKSLSYIYDATPPSGGSFSINNNANYVTGTSVVLTTTCPIDTGISGIQIAFGNSPSPTNRQSCAASFSHILSPGEGTKTVYMRFKDSFENTTSDVVDTIQVDTISPTSPTLLTPSNGATLQTGTTNLSRSGSIDNGAGVSGYIFQVSTTSGFTTIVFSGTTQSTGTNLIGLINGTTYYRRVIAQDLVGNISSRSSSSMFSVIPLIAFAIESPSSFSLGTIAAPETTQIIEKTFTGTNNYFQISDYVGDDAGYYTTLSMSNLSNENGSVLSNQNIAIKTTSNVLTLAGDTNPNVVSSITGSYKTFGNDVLTFIRRDPGNNGGAKGTYAITPGLKITIPQLQNIGNYSGTLIYTIYPN